MHLKTFGALKAGTWNSLHHIMPSFSLIVNKKNGKSTKKEFLKCSLSLCRDVSSLDSPINEIFIWICGQMSLLFWNDILSHNLRFQKKYELKNISYSTSIDRKTVT